MTQNLYCPQEHTAPASQEASSALQARVAIVRASDPKATVFTAAGGASMTEPASSVIAGGLLAKLLPAGLGALVMVCVDPPQCKRELFARVFAGLVCALLFTEMTMDLLHSVSWFSALDVHNVWHVIAVGGLWGAIGWSFLGGVTMLGKKFRADPIGTIDEAKKVV